MNLQQYIPDVIVLQILKMLFISARGQYGCN